MLSTILIRAPWLAFTVLLLVLAAGPLLGAALARRPRLIRLLLVISLLVVAGLTLSPDGGTGVVRCTVDLPYLAPTAVESTANILMLVPTTMLIGLAWHRPLVAIAIGSGISVVIETLQAIVPFIGRACDTADWITNSIGAVLGGFIALAGLAIDRRRQRRSSSASDASA